MKIIVSLLLVTMLPLGVLAQNDTIWFSTNWKKTTKENARFFRPKPQKINDSLYLFKDYYRNGQLQMQGTSKDPEKDVFEGEIIWYNEDGSIASTSTYKNNRLEGKRTTYFNGKAYEAFYKNGKIKQGEVAIDSKNYEPVVTTFIDGIISKRVYYFNTLKTAIKAIEIYIPTEVNSSNYLYTKTFFDISGNQIGNVEYASNGYTIKNGTKIVYHLGEDTDKVFKKRYHKNGKLWYQDSFYKNGNPREKHTLKPEHTLTYYKPNGEAIATLVYSIDNKPFSGEKISFYDHTEAPEGTISTREAYKNGNVYNQKNYYTNGQLKTEIFYTDSDNTYPTIDREIAYNADGTLLGKLTYKDFIPYNGYRLSKNKEEWFKNGKIEKSIEYFTNTKNKKIERNGNVQKFFNTKGSLLGELEIDSTKTFIKPLNGAEVLCDNKGFIYTINTFKAGKRIKSEHFKKMLYNKEKVMKAEVLYNDPNNPYSKTKEIVYYANGNTQSETTFDNYNKQEGWFYDKNGKQIGHYNYNTKTGTKYEFFSRTDKIKRISTKVNDDLISEKTYKELVDYDADPRTANYVLISDVNTNDKAQFYDTKGKLLHTLYFKNKKPYEGTAVNSNLLETIEFKNGQQHGAFVKYYNASFSKIRINGNYVNNKKDGEFTYYDYFGKKEKTEQYQSGELHGKTTFYKDGVVVSEIIYKNDKPYQGDVVSKRYNNANTITSYQNGNVVKEVIKASTGTITMEYNGDNINTTIFHPNTIAKKYEFTTNKNQDYISGTVTRYNTQGKKMHTAELKHGKLVSGELWVKEENNYDFTEAKYAILKQDTLYFSVSLRDKNSNELFTAKESLSIGTSVIKDRLYLNYDFIKPEQLY